MIIFDTETTGLMLPLATPISRQPRIIEFAGVKINDKTLEEEERLSFLCNPMQKLKPHIVKLTKITDDDLKDQPLFSFYLKDLINFFDGEKVMVAHNVMFDYWVLMFELMRLKKVDEFPMPEVKICTVIQSKYINGHRLKLANLYEYLCDQKIKEAHRAMNDTVALCDSVRELHKYKRLY